MGVLTLFLSRKKAIFFVFAGIIFYLFMSGFDAPLVRAAIMSFWPFGHRKPEELLMPGGFSL
jgi:predicted membrane metal-binding protein